MIYKAILVVQSVNITLNINEMYTNPLFVQCPHVTNMTNVIAMELLKKAPKCVFMQQNSDIAISQNNSVLYNMFICQSNQNHQNYSWRGDIGIFRMRHRISVKGAIRWPIAFFLSEAV